MKMFIARAIIYWLGYAGMFYGSTSPEARSFFFMLGLILAFDVFIFFLTVLMLNIDRPKLVKVYRTDVENKKRLSNRTLRLMGRCALYLLIGCAAANGWYASGVFLIMDDLIIAACRGIIFIAAQPDQPK